MGVHGLWSLLQPVGKPVRLEALEGKILAIDVSLWLHQATKGMRDRSGNPVPNAHLIVLFNRVCKLLYYRIKPIFVFDGGVPVLKWQTLALRREQKEIAAEKSGEISDRILHNILKQQLLNRTIQKDSPKKGSSRSSSNTEAGSSSELVSRLLPSKPRQRDMFELEDLPESSQQYLNEANEEAPWDRVHSLLDSHYQNIKDVNVDSEEFQSLPPEIQHEFLREIKESMKRSSWNQINELPEDAGDFASYQISKLLKQNKISSQIVRVQDEIIAKTSGKLTSETGFADKVVNIKKIASEDSSHFIFVKGLQKDTALKVIERTKEEIKEDDMSDASDEGSTTKQPPSYRCPDSVHTSGNQWVEEMSSGGASKCKKSYDKLPNIKQEKNFLNEQEKLENESKDSTNSQNLFSIDKNILFNWAKLAESGKHNVAQMPVEESGNITSTSSYVKISSSDSDSEESEDDQILKAKTHLKQTAPENPVSVAKAAEIKPVPVGDSKGSFTSERQASSQDESSVLLRDVTIGTVANTDVTIERVSATEESKRDMAVPSEEFQQEKIHSESDDSEEGDLVEVNEIEDVEKLYSDAQSHDMSKALPLADEDRNQMPDDKTGVHTLYTEDDYEEKEEEEVRGLQRKVEVNEFEGLTRENMLTMKSELEAESNALLQERGKQERLATTISEQMRLEAQELLQLFGVPFIVSPMEAEAQCAYLDITKQTDGTITDDSDVWLFGGEKVYKNFFNQNKQVEFFTMTEVKKTLGLERERMIKMALLCGSDYAPGIAGVGPVTALEVLAEFKGKDLDGLKTLKDWWDSTRDQIKIPQEIKLKSKLRQMEIHDGFPNGAVIEAYENPEVDESEDSFSWALPKLDELRLYTSEKLGWTKNKTDVVLLPVLSELNKPAKQQLEITSFFIREPAAEGILGKKCSSKRVQRALQRCQQEQPSTSINEQRMKRAKEVVQQMREDGSLPKCRGSTLPMKRRGQQGSRGKTTSGRGRGRGRGKEPRSVKFARTTAPVKYKLSESSSSESDTD